MNHYFHLADKKIEAQNAYIEEDVYICGFGLNCLTQDPREQRLGGPVSQERTRGDLQRVHL